MHCCVGWVTRPECPKGVKDVIKQARRAATWKSGPGGAPRLLCLYICICICLCSYICICPLSSFGTICSLSGRVCGSSWQEWGVPAGRSEVEPINLMTINDLRLASMIYRLGGVSRQGQHGKLVTGERDAAIFKNPLYLCLYLSQGA